MGKPDAVRRARAALPPPSSPPPLLLLLLPPPPGQLPPGTPDPNRSSPSGRVNVPVHRGPSSGTATTTTIAAPLRSQHGPQHRLPCSPIAIRASSSVHALFAYRSSPGRSSFSARAFSRLRSSARIIRSVVGWSSACSLVVESYTVRYPPEKGPDMRSERFAIAASEV